MGELTRLVKERLPLSMPIGNANKGSCAGCCCRYMPVDTVDPATLSSSIETSLQACLDLCTATCAFANYNYDTGNCTVVIPDAVSTPV